VCAADCRVFLRVYQNEIHLKWLLPFVVCEGACCDLYTAGRVEVQSLVTSLVTWMPNAQTPCYHCVLNLPIV
jgi:hypothetical protein